MSDHEIRLGLVALVHNPLKTRPRFAGLLLVVVVLMAAACGQADADSPMVNAAELQGESPIDSYFGQFTKAGGALDAWRGRVQLDVAQCMKLAGFEYVPAAELATSPQDADRDVLTDDEWRAQYGYGVVSATIHVARSTAVEDPNAEILAAFSLAEREAYQLALVGQVDPNTGQTLDPDKAGCVGEAVDTYGGQELFEQMDTFANDRQNSLQRLAARAEMTTAQRQWEQCMLGAGYDFGSHEEAEESIVVAASRLVAPVQQDLRRMSPADRDTALERGIESMVGFPDDDLARLQEREIDLASTDWSCYKSHVEPTWLPLRDQIELELLDENRESLEQLRSALEKPA